jgi:hypothetical protein
MVGTGITAAAVRFISLLFLCAVLGVAQEDGQESWARAKGFYVDPVNTAKSKQAVQFYVVLSNDGRHLSTEHQFRSGDRLQFQFALKQAAYVYVLNSTVPTDDPAALHLARVNGIVRIRPDGQPLLPVPFDGARVLLPLNEAAPAKTPPGVQTNGALFVMDEETGLELLTIVVAPEPLNAQRLTRQGSSADDTTESALANISEASLALWAGNCEVSLAPAEGYRSPQGNGIQPAKTESYVVARDSARPFAFQVSLQHLPRR